MKRVFTYYNYEDMSYVSEKECRARLGDEKFEAMMKEAIETMERENSTECSFMESILSGELSGEKSPYFDWYVEERTQQIRYTWSVFGVAVLACVAMAVIGKFFDPAPWIRTVFAVLGFGTLGLGSIIKILGTVKMDPDLNDIGIPLFFAGVLMVSGLFLLTL